MHRLLTEGIASGEVVPLPMNKFGRGQAGNAFRFMAAGARSVCAIAAGGGQAFPSAASPGREVPNGFMRTAAQGRKRVMTKASSATRRHAHGQGADPDGG